MNRYPSAEDYVRAVQRPEDAFRSAALKTADFEVHPVLQIPMPASGNAAVVFRATVDGTDRALRFFTRADVSSKGRYGALGAYFVERGLQDCVALAGWRDDAIAVSGRTWPMVDMQRVEGRTLDEYVDHLVDTGDTAALRKLAAAWRALVARLQNAGFAHGDLQHGNVLVDDSGALRLVDFDGSWIDSSLPGPAPDESGHPNYQLPGRAWGRWMDTFPGLVVYTALLALGRDTSLWARFHKGEDMLFTAPDLADPGTTDVWSALAALGDADVDRAVALVQRCCAPGGEPARGLESLLDAHPVAAKRLVTVDSPWWDKVGVVAPAAQPDTPPRPPSRTRPRTPTVHTSATTTVSAPGWHEKPTVGSHPSPESVTPSTPATTPSGGRGFTMWPLWSIGVAAVAGALAWLSVSLIVGMPYDLLDPGALVAAAMSGLIGLIVIPRHVAAAPHVPGSAPPRVSARLVVTALLAALAIGIPTGLVARSALDVDRQAAPAAPTPIPTPTPPASVAPRVVVPGTAAMTTAELDLYVALPMPGVDFAECAGTTGTSAIDGLRAALSCPLTTSAIDQPIEYFTFADAASMDAYLQTAADRITAPGDCNAGDEQDGKWHVDTGPTLGRMVCAQEWTTDGHFFTISWATTSQLTVAVLRGSSPEATYEWWVSEDNIQFST